jgi:hypothetical protein
VSTRTNRKILAGLILTFIWIAAGTFGLLPALSNSYLGASHSMFAPLAVLLDVIIYTLLTFSIVTGIFWIYDRIN